VKTKMKLYCPRPESQKDKSRKNIITEILSILGENYCGKL